MNLRTPHIIANTRYIEYVFILRLAKWIFLSVRSTVKSKKSVPLQARDAQRVPGS